MSSAGSEDALLALIDRHFALNRAKLELGRGDDCAIIEARNSLAVSTDLFLEDAHFRQSYFTPGEIGHKALAVNLSDLAAMGARPLAFTMALGLPPDTALDWLDKMLEGMAALANQHDLALCGGDLSAAEKIHFSITIFGEKPLGGRFLERSNCKAGDILFAAGQPGLARVGLSQLENLGRSAVSAWPVSCAAHLKPEPLVSIGLALGQYQHLGRPPALMDISDGLARDLPRMLKGSSKKNGDVLGATLTIPAENLAPEVLRYAALNQLDPLDVALAGGEDYGLLGACAPELWEILAGEISDLRQIGEVVPEPVLICNGAPVNPGAGFDHFAGGSS